MDSLTYYYNKNTNQLAEVTDAIPSTYYTVDIDNETSKHNYRYNGIGELASDSIAGIDSIYWTVYNKVKKIVKTNNDSIVYMYDPLGNRLEQKTFPHSGTADTMKYTRDAQGHIMAVYDRKKDTVKLSEFDIYGASRIGSDDTILRMQKPVTGYGSIDSLTISYLERQKQYELDNQLGNVIATVSDGKTPVDTNAATHDTVASYYLPIVINAQDYYPFGMVQPGRSYSLSTDSSYRFGFDGQMKDNNIYGQNNAYTAEFWEYDPRLGRRWNPDPKPIYGVSDYASFKDNPILYIDPHGDSVWIYATTLPGAPGVLSKATHTFIVVKDKDNNVHYFEYGPKDKDNGDPGSPFGGSPLVKLHYQQDEEVVKDADKGKKNENLKAKILVTPPKGQTSDQFDQAVINAANSYSNDPDVKYVLTGGGDDFTGNCNTSSSTILSKAGLSDKDLSDIEKQIPGIDAGFGKVKAWTKPELKLSQQTEQKNKEAVRHINAILGNPPKE